MSLQLYINEKPVILKEDSGIYLNYEANSLENLAQRSGTLSEEFELEDCHQNRKALGNMQILNSATTTPYELLPARIEVKGNHFMSGSASVSDVEEGYPANFSSDNADLFQRIKDRLISEIDLSDLDHAWTNANVTAANAHDPARGYTYPLVNYGRWSSRRYDPTNQSYSELYPAVYVRTLLERMAAPYTLSGSLLSEERFNRLVVAFTNEVFRYRESYRDNFDASAYAGADVDLSLPSHLNLIPFNSPISDPSGQINLGAFRAQHNGEWNIRVELGFNIFADFEGEIRLFRNTGGESVVLATATVNAGVDQVVSLEATTYLNATESIQVEVQTDNTDTGFAFAKADSKLTAVMLPDVYPGLPVHLEANLPEIKQDELLATVVNAFDVVIQTNDLTKTITLDLRRDMVSRPERDWTRKIDFSRRPKISFKPEFYAQRNVFTYAENESTDNSGRPIADRMAIRMYNANSEPEKEVYAAPFTNTLNAPAFLGGYILPLIPLWAQQVKSFGLWRATVPYDLEDYVHHNGEYWMANTDVPVGVEPHQTADEWNRVDIGGVFSRKDATPRLLVLEERANGAGVSVGEPAGTVTAFMVGGVFDAADAELTLRFEVLRSQYYSVLERILARPKFITLLMRLTPADVSLLDFMQPIAINRPELNLQGLFYLRRINQYNPAERDSVAVDLALIGTIPTDAGGSANREHSEEYSEEYA